MRRVFGSALLMLLAGMTPAAVASCTMSAPTAMAFNTYTGVVDNVTSTITVTCTWFSSYSISLNAGTGSGATVTSRTMTGPGAPALAYQLFSDSARTQNWANNAPGQTCNTFQGCTYPVTVYGRIPANQLIVPGAFTDTIIASSSGSATVSIPVSASYNSFCLVPTTTALNFGNYTGAQLDSAGTISITCSNSTTYWIGIQTGLHGSGNWDWELLGPSSNLLSYKIFKDSVRQNFWGGNPNGDAVPGTGSGIAQPYTAYGRIAAGQYVHTGSYTDTITYTLYF